MAVRVLLSENRRMVRDALCALLQANGEFLVAAEVCDGVSAVRLWRELHPDVALLAIHLNLMNGIDAAAAILKESADAGIVMLAADAGDWLLRSAALCGARGLVLAESSAPVLLHAMRTVAAGGRYMDALPVRAGEAPVRRIESLSRREREVLSMVSHGQSSREIAAELDLGVETVRTYRKSMMRKLKVANTAEATRAAVFAGLSKTPS